MTATLPVPSPFENPSPRRIFLTDAKAIDQHHQMVTSDTFQTAIAVAQREYTRAMCNGIPPGLEKEEVMPCHAMALARLQGANDIITMLCGLAEIPKAPQKAKNPDNLD